jgi:hypothetical protein
VPDQPTLDLLQEVDAAVQRLVQLENQAEQDLQQAKALIDRLVAAHPDNVSHGHTARLGDIIHMLELSIHANNDIHNQLVGEINNARETAQGRETEYQPSTI